MVKGVHSVFTLNKMQQIQLHVTVFQQNIIETAEKLKI